MTYIYIAYEINLWSYTQRVDFTLGYSLLGAIKLTKIAILISKNILAMALDFMCFEMFLYQIVVGLVKM